ncbi:MAG: tRNA ((37)-N6)-threonylcarbamoyltransferase complex ATPase subunit type 1 TsaE [Pseudomonadota bacterium]|jgi:tRNA threonylcarbamoyladenosine biosynthesis protein TsaE
MSVPDRTVIHPAIVKTTAWANEADTQAFAARLAGALLALPQSGDALIELHGDLGAGKTTLARHLLQALGVKGRIKSPTYALLEPYQLNLPTGALAVSHLDFYRLGDPQEWEDAGLRDLFAAPGLKLVEWPERVAGLMPPPDLRVFIGLTAASEQAPPIREVRLQAASHTGQALLTALT